MKKKFLTILAAGALSVASCDTDKLVIKNQGAYDSGSYFATLNEVNQSLTANYASLLDVGLYSRDFYFIFDALGNDAERDFPALGAEQQLTEFSHTSETSHTTNLWKTLYRMVFRANFTIEKANLLKLTSPEDIAKRNRFIAEAKFLKSWANFMLVNSWGRVPLKNTLEDAQKFDMSRNSIEEIYKAVEADLTDAIKFLPVKYASADRGRITQGAAIAMLGKAYLYQNKWAQAETEFKKITDGRYELNANFDDQFSTSNNSSKESIFDIPHRWSGWATGNKYYMFAGQEGWGGKTTHTGRAQEYGFNDWNNYGISPGAVKAFNYNDESGKAYMDPRAKLTFYGTGADGGDDTYCDKCASGVVKYDAVKSGTKFRKYEQYEIKAKHGEPESEINSQVIRYADVLLMLAEAQIEQNKASDALPLINQVRKRVGAFEYKSLGDQAAARTILRRERQIELCGEQVRYFDLQRWGIHKATVNAEKALVNRVGTIYSSLKNNPVEDKHRYLPIPNSEIITNAVLAGDIKDNWN